MSTDTEDRRLSPRIPQKFREKEKNEEPAEEMGNVQQVR